MPIRQTTRPDSPGKPGRGPYPEYKASGVEWLGEIPAHWQKSRLKFAATVNPSRATLPRVPGDLPVSFHAMEAVGNGELLEGVEKPIREVTGGYTSFVDGDVLIAKITPSFENGKGALARGLSNGIGFGTTELHVIRPGPGADQRYTFYLTLSHSFRHPGTGMMQGTAGQQRVPDDFVINFRAPLPPLREQRAISAFLDRETARIDALVAKKGRLIELLQEKRTALISHAITKGLDPNIPMKDSGVEWLGQIPAHWVTKHLRWAIMLQRGHDLPWDEREDGQVPVVSSSGISSTHSRALAKAPGIVTGRYGTIGHFHLITQDYWPLNTTLYSIDLRGNDPRFLRYMLTHLSPLFLLNAVKSAVPGVDRNDIHPTRTAVPPLREQLAIAAFLDRETATIDALVAKVREGIERLKEYRTALISAAVTGKIDVREPGHSGESRNRGMPA